MARTPCRLTAMSLLMALALSSSVRGQDDDPVYNGKKASETPEVRAMV